jgi:hypothetical protein
MPVGALVGAPGRDAAAGFRLKMRASGNVASADAAMAIIAVTQPKELINA